MDNLPPNHFLAQGRPDIFLGLPTPGVVDTTTLAAHDFDVDNRTGFMPPQAPPARLAATWEPWEAALEDAQRRRLQLGQKPDLTQEAKDLSESWRSGVRSVCCLLHSSGQRL